MELPLHPALVHLPIGIAFATPLVALGVAFAIARLWLPKRAWTLVVVMHALVAGTAMFAKETGEDEAKRLAQVVDQQVIHEHEEAAEVFIVGAIALTVLAAAALLLRHELAFRLASLVLAISGFAVLGAALNAGRLGGALIWQHGAASKPAPPPLPSH